MATTVHSSGSNRITLNGEKLRDRIDIKTEIRLDEYVGNIPGIFSSSTGQGTYSPSPTIAVQNDVAHVVISSATSSNSSISQSELSQYTTFDGNTWGQFISIPPVKYRSSDNDLMYSSTTVHKILPTTGGAVYLICRRHGSGSGDNYFIVEAYPNKGYWYTLTVDDGYLMHADNSIVPDPNMAFVRGNNLYIIRPKTSSTYGIYKIGRGVANYTDGDGNMTYCSMYITDTGLELPSDMHNGNLMSDTDVNSLKIINHNDGVYFFSNTADAELGYGGQYYSTQLYFDGNDAPSRFGSVNELTIPGYPASVVNVFGLENDIYFVIKHRWGTNTLPTGGGMYSFMINTTNVSIYKYNPGTCEVEYITNPGVDIQPNSQTSANSVLYRAESEYHSNSRALMYFRMYKVSKSKYSMVNIPKTLPKKEHFAYMSWSEISEVCKAGYAKEYWSIGDSKHISIPSLGITLNMRIIGFDHDLVEDPSKYGRQYAGITLEADEAIYNVQPFYTSESDIPSSVDDMWKNSNVRNVDMENLYIELKNIDQILADSIVPVYKFRDLGCVEGAQSRTVDKIFILSMSEINYNIVYNDGIVIDTSSLWNEDTRRNHNGQYEFYLSGQMTMDTDPITFRLTRSFKKSPNLVSVMGKQYCLEKVTQHYSPTAQALTAGGHVRPAFCI